MDSQRLPIPIEGGKEPQQLRFRGVAFLVAHGIHCISNWLATTLDSTGKATGGDRGADGGTGPC